MESVKPLPETAGLRCCKEGGAEQKRPSLRFAVSPFETAGRIAYNMRTTAEMFSPRTPAGSGSPGALRELAFRLGCFDLHNAGGSPGD